MFIATYIWNIIFGTRLWLKQRPNSRRCFDVPFSILLCSRTFCFLLICSRCFLPVPVSTPRRSTGTAGETLPHWDGTTGSEDQGLSERVLFRSVYTGNATECSTTSFESARTLPVILSVLHLHLLSCLSQVVYLPWCTNIQSLPSLYHVHCGSQRKVEFSSSLPTVVVVFIPQNAPLFFWWWMTAVSDLVGELHELKSTTSTSTAADLLKQGAGWNLMCWDFDMQMLLFFCSSLHSSVFSLLNKPATCSTWTPWKPNVWRDPRRFPRQPNVPWLWIHAQQRRWCISKCRHRESR